MATSNKTSRNKHRPPRRSTAQSPAESRAGRELLISQGEVRLTRHKMREDELRQAKSEIEGLSKYYAELFDTAPVGYAVLDGVGNVREINQAAATLLGQTRESLVNESLARFVPREGLDGFLNHFRLCKSSRKKVATELVLRAHDGSLKPVELISDSFVTPEHEVHCRSVIIDITERRRAEQALRYSQKNYRHLVDSIEGIVWESDASTGHFTLVSQQAERILGYPVERWIREPEFWQNHIHPDDRARVLKAHEQAATGMKHFVMEFRMFTAERRIIWLRNNVNVTHDDHNEVKLQGVMVNITELKETEEALREETRMLEALNRIGMALAGELDLKRLVQVVTDAGKEVTGAMFGAFSYKHLNGHEEPFSLHTTRGAPRDIFEHLSLPPHHSSGPARDAEKEILRIDDVLHDARSPISLTRAGPSRRRPVIRSYLAVPVVSRSGELLGGLFFGHPAPCVFTERSQRLLAGIAAQAAVALDNARLYHAVSKSESHFRQLADAMPQIVWTAGADGRIDYLNRRWYEFTGLKEGVGNNEGWFSFLHDEDCRRCTDAWRKAVASGQPFQAECRLQEHRSGTYRWHLVRAMPIRDEQGQLVSWFGTCTDIDGQKRAEEEVRELNTALERRVSERTAQLQTANKELEAFSYSVSHDLRAPLRSIDAFSQMVREDYADKLDEQGKKYLGIVGESSRKMGQLIDDLLHLSRVTRSEMRHGPVDLSRLAREIMDGLRQAEPQREVESIIAPGLQTEGDERLLRIVLENLLNNAWKFTARQPHARIEVGSETQGNDPVFFVRDNGAGFDMAYADKLFGAFQRLHSTSEFPGHGIGLATVQRIISRHGGGIWASAAVNQGATFYFTLPREEA